MFTQRPQIACRRPAADSTRTAPVKCLSHEKRTTAVRAINANPASSLPDSLYALILTPHRVAADSAIAAGTSRHKPQRHDFFNIKARTGTQFATT
jgi:hypothetical protein